MKTVFFSLFLSFLSCQLLLANEGGHEIKVKIDNFDQDSIFLAVHYGKAQYLQDTAIVNKEGYFVFSSEEPLPTGVYLVVLPPDNNFFQLLVTEKETKISIQADANNLAQGLKFEGSKENTLFYEYLDFLGEQSKIAADVKKEQAATDDAQQEAVNKKLEGIDEAVKKFQRQLISDNPETFTAAIVKANIVDDMPEFIGTPEEQQEKRWRFTQEHYFDNLDLGDSRMLRTPFLFERADFYINKLQVKHPDTIAGAIVTILDKMKPADETFKYYLIHYLNEFANSQFVGMDAIYVRLVEEYYATGEANWTDPDQLVKIVDNAKSLKPLLIGKVAPDITLKNRDGSKFNLHSIEAPFTVLYFWRFDCGVCKKSTPFMKTFYEDFKDKGVKIVAVCTKYTSDVPQCWEYVEEQEVGDWIHAADPYNISKFDKVYNIKSTPQIYILDDKKEIISKRIGAEQLGEVMEQIIKIKEERDALEGSK